MCFPSRRLLATLSARRTGRRCEMTAMDSFSISASSVTQKGPWASTLLPEALRSIASYESWVMRVWIGVSRFLSTRLGLKRGRRFEHRSGLAGVGEVFGRASGHVAVVEFAGGLPASPGLYEDSVNYRQAAQLP